MSEKYWSRPGIAGGHVVIDPSDWLFAIVWDEDQAARIARLLNEDEERQRVQELTRLQDDGCKHADVDCTHVVGPGGPPGAFVQNYGGPAGVFPHDRSVSKEDPDYTAPVIAWRSPTPGDEGDPTASG